MLSLVELKCPHCGAQGQIVLPPLGAIVIGPCPECDEMVVVFCGRAMPLDKATMTDGSAEDRQNHLMDILTAFLDDRTRRLFEDMSEREDAEEEESPAGSTPLGRILPNREAPPEMISQAEFDSFKAVDLRLIDNDDYFKAIFR
jgi:hypothetical protein